MSLGACGVTTRAPAKKPEATAPDFALVAQDGATVKLADLTRGDGHAVLVFYRGLVTMVPRSARRAE